MRASEKEIRHLEVVRYDYVLAKAYSTDESPNNMINYQDQG